VTIIIIIIRTINYIRKNDKNSLRVEKISLFFQHNVLLVWICYILLRAYFLPFQFDMERVRIVIQVKYQKIGVSLTLSCEHFSHYFLGDRSTLPSLRTPLGLGITLLFEALFQREKRDSLQHKSKRFKKL